MTRKKDVLQTDAATKKEQRDRESTKAMLEYEAEVRAIEERTARLRALRLAKEAAEKSEVAPDPVKSLLQRRKLRSMH